MDKNAIIFILCIIASILFFLSQIFLLVQGVINFKFSQFKDTEIIVERILFEQFSEEVYSSINTPLKSQYIIRDHCLNNEEPIQASLKLDTYFDCKDIYSYEIKNCRKSVIHNYTNCENNGKIEFNNYKVTLDDRLIFCDYFSRYTQKITNFGNYSLCGSNSEYKYEDLLYNSISINDVVYGTSNNCENGKKICGILDTKGNKLCLDEGNECPNNEFNFKTVNNNFNSYRKVMNSIIISENKPLSHEWNKIIKEIYEDIDEKDSKKRKEITKRDLGKVVEETDDTYQKLDDSLTVKEIHDYNDIKNYDSSKYNSEQKMNIYYKNYIGFKDYDELTNFKKIFNENNPKDNPLYQLSSLGHDPIIIIVFSVVFLCFVIFYAIYTGIKWKKGNIENTYNLLTIFMIINIIYIVVELIIIIQ